MAYEVRDNTGTMGRNERKEKDSHPDYTGSCVIEGTAYWVSAWIKDSKGRKFFSVSYKRKEEKPDRVQRDSERPAPSDIDDDLPF